MEVALVSAAAAVGLTVVPSNWSITDYKRLIMQIVAEQIGIMEQLFDSFVEDIEAIADILAPQTPQWFRAQFLNLFEYDAIAVPIVQFNEETFIPYYINPNPNYRIIKYCAVVPGILGTTTIKLAKDSGGFPDPLTSPEKDAAQTFANIIATPGLIYNVESKPSDKLFMQLDTFYNGLYSSIIQANVISAIEQYLRTIPFNGVVKISFLKQAILEVEGVNDCSFDNIQARADATTVGLGTNLILNNTELALQWQTIAGYIIPENTTGANWTLTDFRIGSSGIKNLNLISE